MVELCPERIRLGEAVSVPVGLVQAAEPTLTLLEQEPPAPVQERIYEPLLDAVAEPAVAPPVPNPPPVQLVASVLDHVSVEGAVFGDAEMVQVGTATA